MSNLTLKEQLQALSKELPMKSNEPKSKEKKEGQSKKTNAKQKPQWLEQAQYGVELLKAHFPACFKELKEIKPLKIGIKQDLVKHLSTVENIVIGDKACMVGSLSYYVNSPSYHRVVVEGATRVDLNGQPAGTVTAEEAKYSQDCRQAKIQKKQTEAIK